MHEHGLKLEDDAIVCVKGRLDTREEPAKLVAMEITRPQLVLEGGAPITVDLALNRLDDGVVHRLKELLVEHPGDSPVLLKLGAKTVRLPSEFNVDTTNGLIPELRVLPGVAGILL
jgi:DNA polymerase-3 subunit alpha